MAHAHQFPLYAELMLKMSIRRHGILPSGPKIFVSNHLSATDPFMIHIIGHEHMNVLITALVPVLQDS
jgi:1-acyl-sn-glycerol-3-phosphate acyltransferase